MQETAGVPEPLLRLYPSQPVIPSGVVLLVESTRPSVDGSVALASFVQAFVIS